MRYVFGFKSLSGNGAKVRIEQELWLWALEFELLLFHLLAVRPRESNLNSLYLRGNNDTYFIGLLWRSKAKYVQEGMENYTSHILRAEYRLSLYTAQVMNYVT